MDDLTQEQATAILHKYDDTPDLTQANDNDQSDKFYTFLEKLKDHTQKDYEYESGDLIQDANFHSLIFVGEKRHQLIFSNYGNLMSISNEEDVDPNTLNRIKTLAKVLGYTYIPDKLTGQPYDGKDSQTDSWWQRYFSWY